MWQWASTPIDTDVQILRAYYRLGVNEVRDLIGPKRV